VAFSTGGGGSITGAPLAGRSFELIPVAPDTEQLQELEAETRQAWVAYSTDLRELTGEEYERAESKCWEELQARLRRLERERDSLTTSRT
jgi:hypothetical protein